ncbi:FCD domain-containing protein, partial [Candidatus Frankia alpina]|uniref:FCD domain-containing protein n=1 Tax=Candidatus Frankia alpina TaxID=2699483 RepID=UPI0013D070DD
CSLTVTRVSKESTWRFRNSFMEWALEEMRGAADPRAFLDANFRLHMAIARSARVPVLAGLYQTVAAILQSSLTRVEALPEHEEMLARNLDVHTEVVAAIRNRDRDMLTKLMTLHRQDLVRAVDPSRSPAGPEQVSGG